MTEQAQEFIASLEAQNRTLMEMIRHFEEDLAIEERRALLRYL